MLQNFENQLINKKVLVKNIFEHIFINCIKLTVMTQPAGIINLLFSIKCMHRGRSRISEQGVQMWKMEFRSLILHKIPRKNEIFLLQRGFERPPSKSAADIYISGGSLKSIQLEMTSNSTSGLPNHPNYAYSN